MGGGDVSIMGRHIKSVIISPRGGFFMGRHFNVTPAVLRSCAHLRYITATDGCLSALLFPIPATWINAMRYDLIDLLDTDPGAAHEDSQNRR